MIMDLPLFKGVSKVLVSQFLEKTNVDFLNYESGETIMTEGEEVTMVRFVISGAIRLTHTFSTLSITVKETCGSGTVLGADRLYGISTLYPCDGEAVGKTSLMQFSKEQYVSLIQSNRIYMLNFFNYLSLRAQRPIDLLLGYPGGDLRARLSLLIKVITQPGAKEIEIEASDEALARFGGISIEEALEWKTKARRRGLIKCDGDRMRIASKRTFLN